MYFLSQAQEYNFKDFCEYIRYISRESSAVMILNISLFLHYREQENYLYTLLRIKM